MDLFFTALGSIVVLFSLILVGFICRKTNLVSERAQKDVTNIVLYAMLPATIVKTMTKPIDKDAIEMLLTMIAITVVSYIFITILSILVSKRFNLPDKQRDVLFGGMSFANITFMGLPVQEAVFGSEAVFFTIMSQLVIFEIYCWSIGLSILEKHKKGGKFHISIKEVLKKPGVFASIIGLILLFAKVELPPMVDNFVTMLGKGISPLAMIAVGFMLANSNIKEAVRNKYLYISSFVKLLVIPLVMIGVLYALNIRGLVMAIPVIEMAMPTAAYLAMLSAIADNDTTLASEQIFVSSLLSLITIPVIVGILGFTM
ncbi:MAG: AEC family transporter [Bacillota bacterium]|nr:AEC family transporter [Bacillota bacterium]